MLTTTDPGLLNTPLGWLLILLGVAAVAVPLLWVRARCKREKKRNQALANELRGHRNTEEIVRHVAEGVSAVTGERYFQGLVTSLATTLDVPYVFVGRLQPGDAPLINTVAVWARGVIAPNFDYDYSDTSSGSVLTREYFYTDRLHDDPFPDTCCSPQQLKKMDGKGMLFDDIEVNSYLGVPLLSSQGTPLGVLVVMDREPLPQPETTASLLRIFASRAAAELQRLDIEHALQEEQDFVSAVLGTIGALVIVMDREGHTVRFNQACEQLTGYRFEEVAGKQPWDFVLPADEAEAVRDVFNSLTAGHFPSRYENHWLTREGQRRLIDWSNSALLDDQGEVEYVIATGVDITERKASEQAVQVSEQRFRQLAENIHEVFWLISPDFEEVFYVSPAYETIWGRGCDTLYRHPRSWLEAIHPDDLPRVQEYITLKSTGQLDEIAFPEYRVVRPDGSVRWIQTRGYKVRNEAGEVYRIAGIAEDITQRKQAEQALGESEARQSLVLQSLPMAFYAANASSDFSATWISDQIEKISGYPPSAFSDNPRLWTDRLHPDDRKRVFTELTKLKSQPSINIEYRWQVADGSYRWFADHATTTDQAHQVIGTWIDITNRKHAEEEMRLAASVFDGTSEGILVTDGEGIIIQVNQGFSDISGYSAEEALGRTPGILRSDRHSDEFYRGIWEGLEQDGRWQGEIWNRHKDGHVHPVWQNMTTVRDEFGQIKQYIGIFSDITEKKLSEERIRYLAHYDVLTDLPNRLLFEERCRHAIERAHRDKHQVGLLFLDLDHFKHINDSLGHPIGDLLLKHVADRLTGQLREEDTVARLGGDEFTVILEEPRGPADIDQVTRKLMKAFDDPFEIDGHQLRITPSIGISIYPDDGSDVSTLVKNADAAMYRAKEQGRSNYHFYTRDLTAQSLERITLASQLSRALESGELALYYQPQISLKSGVVTGAEALLRWNHPELGLVLPGKFITLAEENGLIIPIGEWVIRTACRDFMEWRELGMPLLQVSVNVAGPQIQRGEIVETVRCILEETGMEPHCLELEITESFIMQEADQAIVTLAKLKGLGVEMAIDDFGTGYSSLSYLKTMPIDKLKIDRSFIEGIPYDGDDIAITKAIISLGKNLQLDIIAEGVETHEQQEFLRAEGCEEVQGYLYSHPIPEPEFLELLKKGIRL